MQKKYMKTKKEYIMAFVGKIPNLICDCDGRYDDCQYCDGTGELKRVECTHCGSNEAIVYNGYNDRTAICLECVNYLFTRFDALGFKTNCIGLLALLALLISMW